jgi:hypothetical protein
MFWRGTNEPIIHPLSGPSSHGRDFNASVERGSDTAPPGVGVLPQGLGVSLAIGRIEWPSANAEPRLFLTLYCK